MAFCWFTTRRRLVGLGYGWLLRGTYGLLAVGALLSGLKFGVNGVRETATALVIVTTFGALGLSIARKGAGVAGQTAEHDRRTARVAAMTGIDREDRSATAAGREFPPVLDLVPAVIGAVGLIGAGLDAGGHAVVAVLRLLVGAAFLGAVSDAMLLGHWYLVQPGLPRKLLNELVSALGWVWPFEVVVLLLPTGMFSVLGGSVVNVLGAVRTDQGS